MANKTNKTQRVFQCHKCSHVFNAEDSSDLKCPKCGSDNIDEKKKKNNLLLPKIIVFLLAVAIGYFVTPILVPKPSSTGNQEEIQPLPIESALTLESGESKSADTIATVEAVEVQVKPIKVVCTAPVNVDNRYVYSFTATSNYDGKNKIEYHLLTEPERIDPIKTSADGNFKDVPPAENPEAFYWVCAVVKDENRTSDTVRVEGLKARPKEKVSKMSKEKILEMLNGRQASSDNTFFQHPVKVDVVEDKTYSNVGAFESFMKMRRKKVSEITDVEYASNNKVISIGVVVVDK